MVYVPPFWPLQPSFDLSPAVGDGIAFGERCSGRIVRG